MKSAEVETGGVYVIRHAPSGECYVGTTADLVKREETHRRQLAGGYSPIRLLQERFTPFNEADFEFEVAEWCGNNGEREAFWIKRLKPSLNRNTSHNKPDKFDAFLSFPCYHWHGEVLEAYRVKYGLRSKGEAVRRIIEGLAEAKGVKR